MPANYDALRQAHRDALDQHLAHQNPQPGTEVGATEQGPTRPENHPSRSQTPGWTADPRMDKQHESANEWAKAGNERKEAQRALAEHEAGASSQDIQKSPETERGQKPTEREVIEARQALAAEHAAAIAPKRDDIER